jgi:alpha/beta superfamily hydrolase
MRKQLFYALLMLTVSLVVSGCGSEPGYLERLEDFETSLLRHGPAPQDWYPAVPPRNVEQVFFDSGDLRLKAWVYIPDGEVETRHPALVYFHGGFAFAPSELEATRPFMDAGYVVMCPMLRGENGNPGNFELFLGEVDDAGAAIQWLAKQSYVDKRHIYAFGHSAGGAISAMLSLREDIPIQHSGSASGIFGPDFFESWSDIVPFDSSIQEEVDLRLLLGNIQHMNSHHHAFAGEEEEYFRKQVTIATSEAQSLKSQELLHIKIVPGDHFSAFQPALTEYLKIAQSAQ